MNDVTYDIVEIPKPLGPYLILEILSRERNQSRGIHVLNMGAKNLIRLVKFLSKMMILLKQGRGHDSEIRIPDISVSRCHAAIKFEKNMFFIEDNASKFGTLVLMKEPIAVNLNHNNVALQVGRTVLYFTAKKTKKVFRAFIGFWFNIFFFDFINRSSITKCNSNITDSSELDLRRKEEEKSVGISPNNANGMGFFDTEHHVEIDQVENPGMPLLEENNHNHVNGNNILDDAPEEEPVYTKDFNI